MTDFSLAPGATPDTQKELLDDLAKLTRVIHGDLRIAGRK
jgi:hypothetical protein